MVPCGPNTARSGPCAGIIIDDEANLRAAIREALGYAGYEAAEAGNDPEGLAQAETICPDVILLDVRIQEGNGYELCRRLPAGPEAEADLGDGPAQTHRTRVEACLRDPRRRNGKEAPR